MPEQLILDKLDKMEQKIDKVETAVALIAVQTERINNISGQVSSLWHKYDEGFGANGIVTKVKNFQAGCPKEAMKQSIDRQWVCIGLLATTVIGIALKAFGIV